jgi:hypothetical protein
MCYIKRVTWVDLIAHLNKCYNFGIEIVSPEHWAKISFKNISKSSEFFKLLPMYKYTNHWKIFNIGLKVCSYNTNQLIEKLGMSYPSPEQLIESYISKII